MVGLPMELEVTVDRAKEEVLRMTINDRFKFQVTMEALGVVRALSRPD